MALTDILAARALSARATAAVDCGALGTLTVEALPLRDAERFTVGGDGDRGLVYAACRELQQAGQALFEAGRVRSPMGVMDFVSEEEIGQAAVTVRLLSGLPGAADREQGEIRPQSVQEKTVSRDAEPEHSEEIRLAAAQENVGAPGQNRPSPVQAAEVPSGEAGQASRETASETAAKGRDGKPDGKSQVMAETAENRTQNLVEEGASEAHLPQGTTEETGGLYETTSEFAGISPLTLHESKSEQGRSLHESKSDYPAGLHETTSESAESPRESKSELRDDLHETESELAERVARRLLEGLRQAAWVR